MYGKFACSSCTCCSHHGYTLTAHNNVPSLVCHIWGMLLANVLLLLTVATCASRVPYRQPDTMKVSNNHTRHQQALEFTLSVLSAGAIQWNDTSGNCPEPEGHSALPDGRHSNQEPAEAHPGHYHHRWGAHWRAKDHSRQCHQECHRL